MVKLLPLPKTSFFPSSLHSIVGDGIPVTSQVRVMLLPSVTAVILGVIEAVGPTKAKERQ